MNEKPKKKIAIGPYGQMEAKKGLQPIHYVVITFLLILVFLTAFQLYKLVGENTDMTAHKVELQEKKRSELISRVTSTISED